MDTLDLQVLKYGRLHCYSLPYTAIVGVLCSSRCGVVGNPLQCVAMY